ncbi:hypothetical protein EMIT093MI4_10107 [Pseudomonas sp. IT-93MI4]
MCPGTAMRWGAEKGRHYDKVPPLMTEIFDANQLACLDTHKSPLWERACSGRRSDESGVSATYLPLTHRLREQARSHRGDMWCSGV